METQPAHRQAPTTLSSPILSYDPQAGPTLPLDKLYTPQIQTNTFQLRPVSSRAQPQVPSPSLIWATAVSRTTPTIVSETGPRETNETKISYGTLRHSYKQCLTQHPNRIWEGRSAETPGLNSSAKPCPSPIPALRLPLPSRAREFVPPPALPA